MTVPCRTFSRPVVRGFTVTDYTTMLKYWIHLAVLFLFAASFTSGWVDMSGISLTYANMKQSYSPPLLLKSFVLPVPNLASKYLLARARQTSVRLYMSGSQQSSDDDRVLFVGNLPWVVDSYGLKKLFEKFGPIFNAQVSYDDRNDRSRGYGHVVFRNAEDARNAILAMNDRDVGGRMIQVHLAQKRRVPPQAVRLDPKVREEEVSSRRRKDRKSRDR
eukprot:749513-Hanusia_phi.AAC.1